MAHPAGLREQSHQHRDTMLEKLHKALEAWHLSSQTEVHQLRDCNTPSATFNSRLWHSRTEWHTNLIKWKSKKAVFCENHLWLAVNSPLLPTALPWILYYMWSDNLNFCFLYVVQQANYFANLFSIKRESSYAEDMLLTKDTIQRVLFL